MYESKKFSDITDEDWLKFFEINVMGGIRLARAYFEGMLARNWGRIIFVSSESGLMIPSDIKELHLLFQKCIFSCFQIGL
ncbi:SDR family NAD(P)-dependent oxidoreductase [Legionella sp.]|uniref:SDR family NAD(P)-dependent oxidoreductase n=1 Tax=Legionella sp. TaxID=459 RepID=UPI003D1449EA